jgi:glycosyltransferase involved in cell wall biosynthesis
MIREIDISVILPCYNEAKVLKSTVLAVRRILEKTKYEYEIIIAEDASTDGTQQIARGLTQEFSNVIWLHRNVRGERGSAVSNAIRNSRGRIVGFVDVDLETPAHYILPMIIEVESGADIAIGVRVFKLNKYQIFFRMPKVLSHYCYHWLSRKVLRTNLIDTESGLKFFNKERILPILDEIKSKHWFWDTEIMIRSYYKDYKINEILTLFIPNYSRVSKVSLLKDSLAYLQNLFIFRGELRKSGKFKKSKKI